MIKAAFLGVAPAVEHPVYGWPATTLSEVDAFDYADMLEGYQDGRSGEPEPGGNRSRDYWHGWRNGAVDGGHRPKDSAQALLAHLTVRAMRGKAGAL